jgi:hypothetical protein
MSNPKDYTGMKFGKLTAVQFSGKYYSTSSGNKKRIWCFQCDCGNACEKVMEKAVKGWITSCGCIRAAQHWGVAAIQYMVYSEGYKDGDLTLEQFIKLSQLPCYWCGGWSPSTRKARSNKALSWCYHGLDRIDQSRGHFADNVVPCCWVCNDMRSNLSLPKWIEHIQAIYLHRVKQEDNNE